jgi:hypothetical protein
VFWVAHTARTLIFVKQLAALEYALTRELAGLKGSLTKLCADHPRASLATLSHEINYLAAIWTDCDLVLPEGFPLHNAGSDRSIAQRAAMLLRFYGADSAEWRAFNLDQHPRYRDSWMHSRLLAEQQGFIYCLFHREGSHQGRSLEAPGPQALEQIMSGAVPMPAQITPDIVVVDPTSKFFGEPDLRAHRRVYLREPVEVWVPAAWNRER